MRIIKSTTNKPKIRIKVIGFISYDSLESITKSYNMNPDILCHAVYPEIYDESIKVLKKYLWRKKYLYSGEVMQNRGIPVLMDLVSGQVIVIWKTWRSWGAFVSEIVNEHDKKANTDYLTYYMDNHHKSKFPKYDQKKVFNYIRMNLDVLSKIDSTKSIDRRNSDYEFREEP